MKLVIAIIHDRDEKRAGKALRQAGFRFTKVASTGGFLVQGNSTFFIGVPKEEVNDVLAILEDVSRTREQYVNVMPPEASPVGTFLTNPVKVQVGGAVVFVVDVERAERF